MYGNYTLIDELYRTEFGFVGTARAADAPHGAPPRLVKVFSPAVGDEAARNAEADSFVERARAQQKLAAGDGEHWGRIYDLGRTPDGAYYVTDFHPLTLRKLLDARLDVSAGALYRTVKGIVDGLRELEAALGRPHGNLKPANVLLVGRGEMSRSGVALTDMAAPSMAASVGGAADRFALGQIIHELVLQRPFDDGTVWPLPPDPTWTHRLGPAGEAWRRLCDDLLAPAPPPSASTLAAVAKSVRRLAPRRRGVRRLVPLSGAALVALAVVGAILYSGYNAQRHYCIAKRGWLGDFARAAREPARRALYERDPTLKGVIVEFDRLDPASVNCDARPVPLSVAEFTRAREAMQSLDRINVALDPENWPAVIRAAKAQRQFRARAWHQPADAIARLIEGLKPGQRDLATHVDQFLLLDRFDADVAAIEAAWKALDGPSKSLQGASDPVFQAMGKVLRESGGAAVHVSPTGVAGAERLNANAALAARAASALAAANDVPPKTDLARFAADMAKQVPPDRMKVDDIAAWLGKLDVYAVRTGDIAPVVAALRERLSDVSREVVASKPDQAKRAKFDADRGRVEADIAALERSPLIEAEVRDGVLARRRDALAGAVESLIKYRRPQSPAEWIQTLDTLATSSDRLNDYWQSWKRVLPGRLPEIDRPGGMEVFEGIKKVTYRLRNDLEALDKTFPKPPGALPEPFAAAARAKREQAFDALLTHGMPSVNDGFRQDAIARSAASYSAWTTNLRALASDFPLRKSLLALDDRPDEAWRKKEPDFWTDPLVRGLVEADVNRILRVQSLAHFPRAELMQTAASDTEAEVVLAAWRLLGRQKDPAWPTGKGELDAEAKLSRRLQEMLLGVANVAERDDAIADVRKQGPTRWRTGVEGATSESQLAQALELRKTFNIDADEYRRLKPEARFNLSLYTARILALRQGGDEAMRPIVEALLESAGELRGRTSTADLLYKLGRLDAPEPFSAQEPGNFFSPEIFGVTIEFKRVELRNVRPFYLQTTELTVDQFTRLLNGAQAWDAAQRLPWGHAPGVREPGRGPRGWEWTGSRGSPMGAAEFWLHPEEANEFPADFLASRFNKSALKDEVGGNPSLDHPMQQLSAQAALYVAGLTGCRLPTSREWLAAYAVFEKDVARERWNLRDQTWDAQRRHVAAMEKPDGRWPDANAFTPEGVAVAAGKDAAAGKQSDGTLFFRREADGGGGTFHHLVGNVAEIVCDAPGQFDAWQDKRTPEGVALFAGQLQGKLFVIGGSALSAPEMATDTPHPLSRTDRAYAAVGVRLAFTAPVKTLAERLKWVLLEQPYTWNEHSPPAAAPETVRTTTPSAGESIGTADRSELNK
jgi:hypothetical protein